MSWGEFSILLYGLGADTPLARVVSIRSEDDPKRVKEMPPEHKRIRNEWRQRQFEKKPQIEKDKMMEELQTTVLRMVRGLAAD